MAEHGFSFHSLACLLGYIAGSFSLGKGRDRILLLFITEYNSPPPLYTSLFLPCEIAIFVCDMHMHMHMQYPFFFCFRLIFLGTSD